MKDLKPPRLSNYSSIFRQSSAFGDVETEKEYMRTRYVWVPTINYSHFSNIDVRFFLAYIGRYYIYIDYTIENLQVDNYNRMN